MGNIIRKDKQVVSESTNLGLVSKISSSNTHRMLDYCTTFSIKLIYLMASIL